MAFFKNFPKIFYSFGDDREPNVKVLADIITNVRLIKQVTANITLWEYYDMKEGETPEILAHRLYGNPEYHWIIMLVNERYDVYSDFPLKQDQLDAYIEKKYPNPSATKWYTDSEGVVVDFNYPGAKKVSFRDYEYSKNEAKRRIKIVSPDVATRIYNELRNLIGKN